MEQQINIVTICGSVRPGNYTAKALALVVDELSKRPEVKVTPVYWDEFDLPFPGKPARDASAERLRQLVKGATGVVIATPEYHGSFSSVIKLAIENLGHPSALKNKPVSLLGVAAGRIGAVKSLEHLRSVVSHVGAITLPKMVSIDRVREKFDVEGTILDEETEIQLRGLASNLLEYTREAVCPKFVLEDILQA